MLEKISNDWRHEILRTVELGHQGERNFFNWQMRFLDEHYLGQIAIEEMLGGVLLEFGRGSIEDARVHAMANRLVGRVAALAS